MKAINIYVEDEDFEKLEKKKGEKSWREFVLLLLTLKEEKAKT